MRLALEPECLENPTATAREIPRDGADSIRDTQAVCGFRWWASKHAPLFHTINTMVAIFLAKVTRHLRPDALGQQSGVELLKRTGFARGHDRRTLQQILQIVIAIFVQSANRCWLLGTLQLPFHIAVIGTAVRLNAQTTEGPQLSLGAKPMRGLQDAQQHGRPDRTDRRNLAEPFPGLVFLAFRQQLAPN